MVNSNENIKQKLQKMLDSGIRVFYHPVAAFIIVSSFNLT